MPKLTSSSRIWTLTMDNSLIYDKRSQSLSRCLELLSVKNMYSSKDKLYFLQINLA